MNRRVLFAKLTAIEVMDSPELNIATVAYTSFI